MLDHTLLIGNAAHIPARTPAPVVVAGPILLSVPARVVDLELRVSAPTTGDQLPILVLSHPASLESDGPLAQLWAAHGFVVIEPIHLESPRSPSSRVDDLQYIRDRLHVIEVCVPAILGRVDRSRVTSVMLTPPAETTLRPWLSAGASSAGRSTRSAT